MNILATACGDWKWSQVAQLECTRPSNHGVLLLINSGKHLGNWKTHGAPEFGPITLWGYLVIISAIPSFPIWLLHHWGNVRSNGWAILASLWFFGHPPAILWQLIPSVDLENLGMGSYLPSQIQKSWQTKRWTEAPGTTFCTCSPHQSSMNFGSHIGKTETHFGHLQIKEIIYDKMWTGPCLF